MTTDADILRYTMLRFMHNIAIVHQCDTFKGKGKPPTKEAVTVVAEAECIRLRRAKHRCAMTASVHKCIRAAIQLGTQVPNSTLRSLVCTIFPAGTQYPPARLGEARDGNDTELWTPSVLYTSNKEVLSVLHKRKGVQHSSDRDRDQLHFFIESACRAYLPHTGFTGARTRVPLRPTTFEAILKEPPLFPSATAFADWMADRAWCIQMHRTLSRHCTERERRDTITTLLERVMWTDRKRTAAARPVWSNAVTAILRSNQHHVTPHWTAPYWHPAHFWRQAMSAAADYFHRSATRSGTSDKMGRFLYELLLFGWDDDGVPNPKYVYKRRSTIHATSTKRTKDDTISTKRSKAQSISLRSWGASRLIWATRLASYSRTARQSRLRTRLVSWLRHDRSIFHIDRMALLTSCLKDNDDEYDSDREERPEYIKRRRTCIPQHLLQVRGDRTGGRTIQLKDASTSFPSIEALACHYLRTQDKSVHAVHFENRGWRALTILLFWEVIRGPVSGIQDVMHPWQTVPGDWGTDTFFKRQADIVRTEAKRLAALKTTDLSQLVKERLPIACRLHMDMHDLSPSIQDALPRIVSAIKPTTLVHVCLYLLHHIDERCIGMPDILTWSATGTQLSAVEVKTTDAVSTRQMRWCERLSRTFDVPCSILRIVLE